MKKIKPKPRKKRIKKPIIFIQNCGIYNNDIVVSSGADKKQIIAWLKKQKNVAKDAIKWIEKETEGLERYKINEGTVLYDSGRFLLLLKPYDDNWEYWEVLIHELHHIVFDIAEIKSFEKETEAQAYLQAYLFNKIRRKLQGLEIF